MIPRSTSRCTAEKALPKLYPRSRITTMAQSSRSPR